MKMYSPRLEKALRRRVRERIARSAALKAERKRVRRRRQLAGTVLGVIMYVLFAGACMLRLHPSPGMIVWGSVLLTVVGVAWESVIWGRLMDGGALHVFFHFPAREAEIFDCQWKHITRGVVALGMVFGGGAVGLCYWHVEAKVLPLAFLWGWLQAAIIVTTGSLLAAFMPSFRRCRAAMTVAVVGTLSWVLMPGSWFRPVYDFFETSCPWLQVLLPAGWVNYVFKHGVMQKEWLAFTVLLPMGVFLAALPLARARLKKHYQPFGTDGAEHLVAPVDDEEMEMADVGETSDALGDETEAVAADGGQQADRPIKLYSAVSFEHFGLIERLVWRWLTPWQRTVAEALVLNPPGWTQGLRWAAYLAGIGLSAAWVLGPNWAGFNFLLVITAGLSVVLGTPVLGGAWDGFGLYWCGISIPFYSAFPIGYKEVAPVFVKANLVRLLFFLPVAVGEGALIALLAGYSAADGASIGLRIPVALALLQPVLLAYRFAANTGAGVAYRFGNLFFLLLQVFLMILILVLTIVFVAAPMGASVVVGPVLVALIFLAYWHQRRAYGRSRFDMAAPPKSGEL